MDLEGKATWPTIHILQPHSLQRYMTISSRRKHHHFWFGDGNLLLTSRTVNFRVHVQSVVPRSTMLSNLFLPIIDGIGNGVVCIPIPHDDAEDWACMLGLIYDYGGNSVEKPTLRELLGILTIAEKYAFSRIKDWATTRLRADFFPDPLHFQNDEFCPEADAKVRNAATIIRLSRKMGLESAILGLAYYALARRSPYSMSAMKHARNLTIPALRRILKGRKAMGRRFEIISDMIAQIPHKRRHPICVQSLRKWTANAARGGSDRLQVLQQMWDQHPPGSICVECERNARHVIEEETLSFYHDLPALFGFAKVQEYGWDLQENRKHFLESFRS